MKIIINGVEHDKEEYLKKEIKKNQRKIDVGIWFGILFGLIALLHGVWTFVYKEPLIGINLRTQFPIIGNGSLDIGLGLFMLYFSFSSLKKRKDIIFSKLNNNLLEKGIDLNKTYTENRQMKRERMRKSKRTKR
jgi:hypothetical protein